MFIFFLKKEARGELQFIEEKKKYMVSRIKNVIPGRLEGRSENIYYQVMGYKSKSLDYTLVSKLDFANGFFFFLTNDFANVMTFAITFARDIEQNCFRDFKINAN